MTSSNANNNVVLSRYITALVDLADEDGCLKSVCNDMDALSGIISESDDFQRFMASPFIRKSQQVGVMDKIMDKIGGHKLTRDFIGVLIQNGRLPLLAEAINSFKEFISRRSGEVSVRIETAKPLTAAQKDGFQKKISMALGRDVVLEVGVDPDILGGMVVTIGSYMIDDSVRRKLDALGSALIKGANEDVIQNFKEVG